MKAFTDGQLQSLKKEMPHATYGFDSLIYFGWEDFEALINRLEVAENVIAEIFDSDGYAHITYDSWHEALEEWRKSKGEGG